MAVFQQNFIKTGQLKWSHGLEFLKLLLQSERPGIQISKFQSEFSGYLVCFKWYPLKKKKAQIS